MSNLSLSIVFKDVDGANTQKGFTQLNRADTLKIISKYLSENKIEILQMTVTTPSGNELINKARAEARKAPGAPGVVDEQVKKIIDKNDKKVAAAAQSAATKNKNARRT